MFEAVRFIISEQDNIWNKHKQTDQTNYRKNKNHKFELIMNPSAWEFSFCVLGHIDTPPSENPPSAKDKPTSGLEIISM